jgi:putative transcriptional regulator
MTVKRDIGKELLEAISSIREGQGKRYKIETPSDVKHIRENLDLSQSVFASLMGVSVRTLQEWEQGRRKPSGSAHSLLKIAQQHPEVFTQLS